MESELLIIIRWWLTWFALGMVGWPLTRKLFLKWEDQGYLMAKAVGVFAVTFGVWVLGSWKIAAFSWPTVLMCAAAVLVISHFLVKTSGKFKVSWKIILYEEAMFLAAISVWSYIKAHEPSINGLEKFMDFGFTKSILRGNYFPPADMWFSGKSINYYYFGHLMLAVLTKLSGIDLVYTFNLILAALFGLCFTMSFGIGRQLLKDLTPIKKFAGGMFIAFLVSLSGNLQTIYAFTKGYVGEIPPPFWKIFSDFSNWDDIKSGWKGYWYPNATRFIPFTIHEFPGYSFVVSDIHGHVLGIPLALLAIGLLVLMYEEDKREPRKFAVGFYGWVTGMMFMTNTLDGPVYIALWGMLAITKYSWKDISSVKAWRELVVNTGLLAVTFLLTVFPFITNFEPFVSGLAINCPPAFLENTKYGPVIFETVNKCQKSPLWMMLLLWGMFVYGAVGVWNWRPEGNHVRMKKLFAVAGLFSLLLIIFPEFFYFKDIYPAHFRSNTMFKLGYQVFIIMPIVTGTVLTRAVSKFNQNKWYVIGAVPLVILISIYPWFSIRSYFGNLESYKGLDGSVWMKEQFPGDYEAVAWLNQNIPNGVQPVVLEANGDSYSNYERISTFTGLPTVAGWTVHEWLWRGSYEPIAKRAEDVRIVYESEDINYTRLIIDRYEVKYVVVGNMEREKYPQLNEWKIQSLGIPVFSSEGTTIYQIQ